MSIRRSDGKCVEYWILNTTNKLMENCTAVICMNKKYSKTGAINTRNKFVDLTQLSVQRELILGNSTTKSIGC